MQINYFQIISFCRSSNLHLASSVQSAANSDLNGFVLHKESYLHV